MKQVKIVQAYMTTEDLSKIQDLSVKAKWVLYKLRKDLSYHYDFYVEESRNLFNNYKTEKKGDSIVFESVELAQEYKKKQEEIDNLEVDYQIPKQPLKLSDIPSITVPQIEHLDEFIEFEPE